MTSNNPPAFPSHASLGNLSTGMTLRDYLANTALSSFLNQFPEKYRVNDGWIPEKAYPELAKDSYKMADAMLKEKEKPCP